MNTRADGTLIVNRSNSASQSSQSQADSNGWTDIGDFDTTKIDRFKTVLQDALSDDVFKNAQDDIADISGVLSEDPISVIR